jgi:DNA-3-methyladenine glycosylase I
MRDEGKSAFFLIEFKFSCFIPRIMGHEPIRCWSTQNPLYIRYHDEEWGTPVHDDRKLFELLTLEGFQAGLTWELILKRRTALKEAFADFDPEKVAKYTATKIQETLTNPYVIRNRAKIQAAVNNAQRFIQIQSEFGSFDKFIWQFVNGKPVDHVLKSMTKMPAQTEESLAISKELKKRGFKFVGPTICYAFMQAVGMVNDHLTSCFRYRQLNRQNTAPS